MEIVKHFRVTLILTMKILCIAALLTLAITQQQPKPQGHENGGKQLPAPSAQAATQSQPNPDVKQDSPAAELKQSYGQRLTEPLIANWPLIVVAIGAIWVGWLTLKAMRDSSERQLRAYVLPENAGILDGTMTDPPQPARANIPGIGMLIKNSGQTPAYKVTSLAQIAIIPVADENTLMISALQPRFYNTLGPGGTFNKILWFDRALTAQEIADIRDGMQAIYLYGRIEYKDAFRKMRFANFRLRYNGQFPPLPNAIFNFSESGNDAD